MMEYSFLVLAFNHEKYILEHLESIKYQVEVFGLGKKIKLIINDDASKDKTVALIDKWVSVNKFIFEDVVILKNKTNIGTCHSITNMMTHVGDSLFKITAGDDVYTCNNIFELMELSQNNDIVSGIPFYLLPDKILYDKFIINNMIASDLIYADKNLLRRYKSITFDNAPNACYSNIYFKNENIINYINRFDVTEDWPIQISIARANKIAVSKLVDKCFVLYRRTPGSTYLVASSRFVKDKNKIYEDLMNGSSFCEKILLKNRRWAFGVGKLGRIANFSLYIFYIKYLVNLFKIRERASKLNADLSEINSHYDLVKARSRAYEI